jgi:hypothetical protein
MSEFDDVAAPSEAAVEEVVTEAAETEQAAAPTPEEVEQTETQKRRERRKAQEQRLVDEKATADAKARDLEQRLTRVQAAAAGHQEPKEDDYTDIGAYWAAMGAFNYARTVAQSAVAEVSAEAEQAKQASEYARAAHMQARQVTFEEDKAAARTRYPDYDAAIAVASDARVVSGQLAEMVLQADQPADLAYHLGKNPDMARSLSMMPPQAAAFELGKIAAGLQIPQPKIASNAPAPINPVRPGGTAAKDISKMSGADYIAARASGWHP